MTVFKVQPGDPVSAETMNRVIDACNPEVGDRRAMPLRSKMVPCSVQNTSSDTIQAGWAVLATWRDEEADAETARRRFLRDGICLKMVEHYEVFSHRQRGQTFSPYRRYIPVTLLRTAAPDKIVPGFVSGIFAATVRSNGADKNITEAFWHPDRFPHFFSRGERFEREDSAEYMFDVLAASAPKEAGNTNSQLRWDRFCILRPKTVPPAFVRRVVDTVDENGTITAMYDGGTYAKGEYDSAVDEIQHNDHFWTYDGILVFPVGFTRGVSEARGKAKQALGRTEDLAGCVWWLYQAVWSMKYEGMPGAGSFPDRAFPAGSGRAGLRQWYPEPSNGTPQISGDDDGGENEAGDQSGGD